jgi:uncharacterized protein (TIGR03382 family)
MLRPAHGSCTKPCAQEQPACAPCPPTPLLPLLLLLLLLLLLPYKLALQAWIIQEEMIWQL